MHTPPITVALLDFGSHTIKGILLERNPDDSFNIKAHETMPAQDMVRRGIVMNLVDLATQARRLLDLLEQLGQLPQGSINKVYVSVNGQSLHSLSRSRETHFEESHEILQPDVDELLQEMQNEESGRYEVLGDATPTYYVNGMQTPKPVGMKGLTLRAEAQLIMARYELSENLQAVLHDKLNLDVVLNLAPMALAEQFLTPDQQRIGSVLVDFGAECTSVSVYCRNGLMGMRVIPIGSQHITNDLASSELHISTADAENIKRLHASAISNPNDDRQVEVDNADHLNKKKIPILKINRIVEARATEIVDNIKAYVDRLLPNGRIPGGVVITGGGSMLDQLRELMAKTLDTDVEYATNTKDFGASGAFFSDKPQWHVIYSMIPYADHSSVPVPKVEETLPLSPSPAEELTSTSHSEHTPAHTSNDSGHHAPASTPQSHTSQQHDTSHPEDELMDAEYEGGTTTPQPTRLFDENEMGPIGKPPVKVRSSSKKTQQQPSAKRSKSSFLNKMWSLLTPPPDEEEEVNEPEETN